jgi:hypothetical protein
MKPTYTSPEDEANSPAEKHETKGTPPTETSSKPGKGRIIDATHLGLAFQFIGVKAPPKT